MDQGERFVSLSFATKNRLVCEWHVHTAGSVTNGTLSVIKEALTLFEIWPSARSRNPAGRARTNCEWWHEGKKKCTSANMTTCINTQFVQKMRNWVFVLRLMQMKAPGWSKTSVYGGGESEAWTREEWRGVRAAQTSWSPAADYWKCASHAGDRRHCARRRTSTFTIWDTITQHFLLAFKCLFYPPPPSKALFASIHDIFFFLSAMRKVQDHQLYVLYPELKEKEGRQVLDKPYVI